MMLTIQTVSSKGQLVIPAEMRRKLDIKAGTKVTLAMSQGDLVIKLKPVPVNPIEAAWGSLKKHDVDGKMFQRILQQKREEIARGE